MHRGRFAQAASSIRPAREAAPHRIGALARRDEQPPARRGRERHRHLQLRIIAAAGALIGVGPAGIEHVFAARVRFQIARHDAGDRAVVGFGDEMLRLPAGARRGRAGRLQGGQESMRDEGVIGANLRVPIADWRRRPTARPECPRWSARPGCANQSLASVLRPKALENHLVGPAPGAGPVLRRCAPSR